MYEKRNKKKNRNKKHNNNKRISIYLRTKFMKLNRRY